MLETIVFINGAVIMILEIVGSRILAPYVGTSIFVWTAIIGVILGALSLGYWLGGKLADQKPSFATFSKLLSLSAILIALTIFIKDPILTQIQNSLTDLRYAATLDALLLFAPTSIFLGTISPYAIKLKLHNLDKTGRIAGNLYAISTIGSILGTFATGFYLLAYFGSTQLLIVLAATMALLAFLAILKKKTKQAVAVLVIAILSIIQAGFSVKPALNKTEIDTAYNHLEIFETDYLGHNSLILKMGTGYHSGIDLTSSELLFEYTRYYRLVDHFAPQTTRALMIGGGAFSYPNDFLAAHPAATLDVVEIDPALTEVAQKYFNLKLTPALTIYNEDGRTFLNRNQEKYDAVFMDAFHSYAVPFQLTTREAVQHMYDSLNENGVLITNIISGVSGENNDFLQAEYRTYTSVFPHVYVFPVQYPDDFLTTQNVMLVALKSADQPSFTSENPELNSYLAHLNGNPIPQDLPILTDNFAPVDQYLKSIDTQ